MPGPSPFMALAIEASRRVRGFTSPNPWVGAALVRDGELLATGATAPPGGPHAEAAALAATPDARGATAYVTLEPCAPFEGKRTPPCSEALVAAGVARVVIALEDPDPAVRGRGIARLRDAGIAVEIGDGRDEALALLRPYFKHRATGRPYVIAKFAASLDGRIATATGDSKWITGERARDLGHQQRAWVDAVLAGSGTILADDAALTARPGGELAARQPVRVVLDARGRVPATARLFRETGHIIVATTAAVDPAWRASIAATGATIMDCEPGATGGVNLDQLFAALGRRGILSAWAEGGGETLGSLFAGQHADEVWAFIAPMIIGGDGRAAVGPAGARTIADAWRLRDPVVEQLGTDILVRGYTGEWEP
ncbi:MAG: bifunctional diaminohydroxyphosphoribosylaminopyrimidine deaminase/5-amino-6-(5-phosphoribosylamino)uracil reductase RibD [Dehalococcoidia bacterium]|nr:bifunctional diaminohydroxyphosphoribosylaminopyrimidine deaminase/5-amino-6-(5-phosphoribosylamino)uracil reductase RibD [Dehalococcoidia bacterium]